MTKLKHNKKRNTAFLYESLIRELTKSIINKDDERKEKIISVIKEHFSEDTLLYRELKLYGALNETYRLSPNMAEKLIFEVKKEHSTIDKKKLFVEQTKLINKINKAISKSIFSNFVPNYKDLATIYQVFNTNSVKKKVLLEQSIFGRLTHRSKNEDANMKTMDNLVYKSFVKRFNGKYSEKLLEEQKELLNKYITSFLDNGVELKVYLNEEIVRLKENVSDALSLKEIQEDSDMLMKTKEVMNILENFKKEKIDKVLINKVLKIQDLVKEIKN
tara:strand:- start:401 stop:1222 length:822 start_codon:yes stop_codon:yes gene_type:complete